MGRTSDRGGKSSGEGGQDGYGGQDGEAGVSGERGKGAEEAATGGAEAGRTPRQVEPVELRDEPVELPIGDVLDLHSFRPAEVADLVRDYLDAAHAKGLRDLRIIHGRGTGAQRRTVRTLLGRDPRVVAFADAPAEAGGWGATWVHLRD